MTHKIMQPQYLKVKQVARALGVSELTIRQGCQRGEIPHKRVGRQYLIPPDYIDKLEEVKA